MAVVQRRGSAGFRPLTLFIAVDSKKLYSQSYPADLFVWLSVYWCWRMWMTENVRFFFSPVMNADFSVSALSKCFTLDVTSPLGEENAEKSALLVDGCM